MIKYIYLSGKGVIVTISPTQLEEEQLNIKAITWGDLTWVNIVPPTERETEYLAKRYGFHSLDLDDCLSRQQRPKIDQYPDYLFIIFHFPIYNKATRVSTHGQLSVFVGSNYLITLHTGEIKALEGLFKECETSEEARKENFSYSPGYLLYHILDLSVDSYFRILDKIWTLIENIEDSVFDENVEAAKEIAVLRRDVITQRRIMFPVRTVIGDLENKLKRFTKTDMSLYYGDLVDHLNKICESLDECKEVIEVYKDTDFLLANYRVNRVLRILTILATIGGVLTVVASFYGMNVPLPGGGVIEGDTNAWIALLGIMVTITSIMLLYFRHRRWL